MKCALCKTNEADKKNTHYLTDGIIRSCLNQDGSIEREKGYYFDISSFSPFVDFNFQRNTSVTRLEESLNRQPTEEEINKAKVIPFSVDFVFCSNCESLFTKIETQFIELILPKLRESDITGLTRLKAEEAKLIHLFIYLQVWRSSVCTQTIEISNSSQEELRNILINFNKLEDKRLVKFPIIVTYLQTLGDQKEFTSNFVGLATGNNPIIIFMNDFVIQFFESKDNMRFYELFGINDPENFQNFINTQSDVFIFQIISNAERKVISNKYYEKSKVDNCLQYIALSFRFKWDESIGMRPSLNETEQFMGEITNDNQLNVLTYSKAGIDQFIDDYILKCKK